MSTDNTPGLFEIKLNEEGTRFILKFVRIIRFGILFSCLISLLRIVASFITVLDHRDYSSLPSWMRIYFFTYPYHNIIQGLFIFLLVYYYWKTGDLLKKGIDSKDESYFNNSFRMLYKYALWSTILTVSSFIFSVYDFTLLLYRYLI